MNSKKFIAMLGLLALLILAIGNISAANMDNDMDDSSLELADDGMAVNHIDDSNVASDENTVYAIKNVEEDEKDNSECIGSIDYSYENSVGVTSSLGASPDTDILASTITFRESDYSKYFSSNGKIISGKLKSGDTLDFSGEFTNKTFIINIPLIVTSTDSTAHLTNCAFNFINGSSGSSISNMKINNSVINKPLISVSDADDMTLRENDLFSSATGSHPMTFERVNRMNIYNNTLRSTGYVEGWGHPSAMVFRNAGSCNIYDNTVITNDSNGIYFTGYGATSSMGSGGDAESYSNYIVNNTVYSIRPLPSSFVYAIQVMSSYNYVINNTVYNAYRGISTTGTSNQIIGNVIYNIHGTYSSYSDVEEGADNAIISGPNSLIKDNLIYNSFFNGTKAAIQAGQGSNITNNNITNVTGIGIFIEKGNVNISDNNINVTGYGIYINPYYGNISNVSVSNNIIDSHNKNNIKLIKLGRDKIPNDIIINDNILYNSGVVSIDVPSESQNITLISNILIGGTEPIALDDGEVHFIEESNFYTYFTSTGYLENIIKENDYLIFKGEFSSKNKIHINEKVKILGINASFVDTTFIIDVDDVSISDIKIFNPNHDVKDRLWGIQVNGVNNVSIKNCDISINDTFSAYAIYLLEASNCSIINNTLQARGNYFTAAILSFNSRDILMDGNTIKTIGSGDTYLINNKSCLDGYLSICVDACLDGSITCPDGYTICADGSLLCPDGNVIGSNQFTICVDGSIVCTDGSLICADGTVVSSENTQICPDGVCVDGVTYCLDGTVLLADGTRIVAGGYQITPNNTIICPDGSVCTDGVTVCPDGSIVCTDGTTICADGSVVCPDGTTLCTDGSVNLADGARICADGSIVCTDGTIRCPDGTFINSEICPDGSVCADGVTYCLDGTVLLADGTRIVAGGYRLTSDGTVVCPDGSVCTDGITVCQDGSVVCPDGTTLCTNGTVICADGAFVCADGSIVCADGIIRCPDGTIINYGEGDVNPDGSICVDGTTYYTNGTIEYSNGTVICLDGTGSSNVLDGVIPGSHMVSGVYRTYGVLLIHSSNVNLTNNKIDVSSDLPSNYNLNESYNSIAGVFIHYGGFNNTISNNDILLHSNDPIIYGIGIIGASPNSTAEGSKNNNFTDNNVTIIGPLHGVGIVLGYKAIDSNFLNNNFGIFTNHSHNILTYSGSENNAIEGNSFTGKANSTLVVSNSSYKVDNLNKIISVTLKDEYGNAIANAKIKITVNGKTYTAKTNDKGVATLKVSLNAVKSYSISAKFEGDSYNFASSASGKITITKGSTSLTASGKTFTVTTSSKAIAVTLKDGSGNVIKNKKITATVNGKTYSGTTNSKGVATIKLKLTAVKTYTVSLKFAGDSNYKASTKSIKVKVTKTKTKLAVPKKTYKKAAKNKKLTATLKDQTGKVLKSKKITFTVNGKKYSAKTNSKGVATVKVKLSKKKTYKLTVKFAGDKTYVAVTKTGKVVIK
ncbi:Ig-like domain repeat protein [Methanobrevibacter sp.]|uniref:right-handed parallel beta-helix repeat-containing protein n=1 Tax=Methanobrevibacter sp. TaxID=66852 RepID=UPI0025D2A8FE|nr:Ig-like domain repeat protein [Methanobrevibacter sp.]MBQ2962476.1 right-handed parallel beta-helix repeat-containing protein [Methanobrevibacter sp.]